MPTPDHIRAHRHCSRHREEVLASSQCACFYCLDRFFSYEITQWTDDNEDGIGQTAICPYCNVDAVFGEESGYPLDFEFLKRMQQYWFSKHTCIARFVSKQPDNPQDTK